MSKANMAAESQNCDKFKNKMKKKCPREKRKDSGKPTKELDIIVVHRFSAEVSGKAQKHSRVRVREFVSFEDFPSAKRA